MGYKRERTVYRLKFADDSMNGLEVTVRSISLGSLLRVQELSESKKSEELREVFTIFADALISWNLENEDGTPVVSDVEGILSQETDFVMGIITAWTDAIAGVSRPLNQPSSSGKQSPEELIPMEMS